jgi:hypothetical protein
MLDVAGTAGSGGNEAARQGLHVVKAGKKKVARTTSFVSIRVGEDGHIDFESEIIREHAEQMTDALLLMLLKAREALKNS